MGELRAGPPRLAREAAFARTLVRALVLAVLGTLLWAAPPALAAEVVQPTLVQTIQTSGFSPPSPDPSGIVYMAGPDRLLIGDSEVNETGLYQGSNLFTATRTGSGFGSGTLLARGSLAETSAEPAGVHGTADDVVTRFSTSAFGSADPEDVEYDPATGHLFLCDGGGIEVYTVNPVNGTFGDGNDVVTHFDVARYGATDCEGLGLDASRNTLLALDWRTDAIYELSRRAPAHAQPLGDPNQQLRYSGRHDGAHIQPRRQRVRDELLARRPARRQQLQDAAPGRRPPLRDVAGHVAASAASA